MADFTITTTTNFDDGTHDDTGSTTQNGGTTNADELRLKNWRLSVDVDTEALWHFEEGTGTTLDNAEGTAARDMVINTAGAGDVTWTTDASFENDDVLNFPGGTTDTPTIHIPDNSIFPAINKHTLEMWFKMDTLASTGGITVRLQDKRGPYAILILTDDSIRIQSQDTSNATFSAASAAGVINQTGQWYHLMGTWDKDAGLEIFLDGTSVASTSTSWTPRSRSTVVNFEMGGTQFAGGTGYLDGRMKEVRFSDKVRTISEAIPTIYRASGNWTSESQTMTVGSQMEDIIITHSSLDSNNFIDKVEILDASDDAVITTADANIISGASTTLTSSDFDNGFGGTASIDFKIKVYLEGDATTSLIITQIEGNFEVTPTFGVTLSAPADQTVEAGTNAVYTYTITNTGDSSDTFTMTTTNTNSANRVDLSSSSITLTASANTTFTLTVGHPKRGTFSVTTTATSDNDPGGTPASASDITATEFLVLAGVAMTTVTDKVVNMITESNKTLNVFTETNKVVAMITETNKIIDMATESDKVINMIVRKEVT